MRHARAGSDKRHPPTACPTTNPDQVIHHQRSMLYRNVGECNHKKTPRRPSAAACLDAPATNTTRKRAATNLELAVGGLHSADGAIPLLFQHFHGAADMSSLRLDPFHYLLDRGVDFHLELLILLLSRIGKSERTPKPAAHKLAEVSNCPTRRLSGRPAASMCACRRPRADSGTARLTG